jgi:hypothetical protein
VLGLSSTQSELEILVKSLKFSKISTALLVIPGVFAAISLPIVVIAYLHQQLAQLAGSEVLTLPDEVLTWALLIYYAYVFAALVATYRVLSKIREHIYNSAVTTYYYTRGADFSGALYYLRDMLNRSLLPSPVTGLLLTLLLGGLAYPVLLCFAERAVRDHAALEERAYFKEARTRSYRGAAIAGDLALTILTVGVYIVYLGYRLAKTFNKHVESIHSKHPEPPTTPPPLSGEPGAWIRTSVVVPLLLVFLLVATILASLSVYYQVLPQLGFGLLLSALVAKRAEKSVASNIGVAYLIIVLLVLGGVLVGYTGYRLYTGYYEELERLENVLTRLGVRGVALFIFSNNAALSIPSTVPYIGGVTVASGAYNAGVVLGVASALGRIHLVHALAVLIAPHAPLELLSYATLVSASSRYGYWRKFALIVVTGLLVLFLAAVLETALIVLEISGGAITDLPEAVLRVLEELIRV